MCNVSEIRVVSCESERRACYDVRITVFVDEQLVPIDEELDADDETALHYLVESEGEIIGTARLVDVGDGIGKIGRVALRKEHRGLGIGRDLMVHVMTEGFRGFHTLILDAQVQMIPFYEKLGFLAEGDVFLDAGIPHRRMIRRAKDGG